MKIFSTGISLAVLASVLLLSQCNQKTAEGHSALSVSTTPSFNGFDSQAKWGEHLVTIGGCNDCHSPKKMTDHGPEIDSSLFLSGHPAQMPPPDVNRQEMESKGLSVTNTLTAWVGPWGISYAGNLTSDSTGIGNWKEEQFIYALRNGKYKGLASSRALLPPMPWKVFQHMTDDELKAIFTYLKTTRPVKNVVPQAAPPVSAPRA